MLTRFFVIAFALAWALTVTIALHVQDFIGTRILPPAAGWLIGIVPIVLKSRGALGGPQSGSQGGSQGQRATA